jgi:hypothetical protein
MADGDLTDLREELGIITAQISHTLDQLAKSAEGFSWDSLLAAMIVLQQSRGAALHVAIANLDRLIRSGAATANTRNGLWSELRQLIADKVKAAVAEARRQVELRGVVKVEEALLFARAFLAAAHQTVTDKYQLRKLQERCLALLPGGDVPFGNGNGNGHVDMGPVSDPIPDTPPPAPAPAPASAPTPAPAPGPDDQLSPRGGVEIQPPAPPAPNPDHDPVYGLKELPPGANPDDYEWVPDEGE